LGLSAETGELSDNHDIISLKAENLYSLNRGNNNKGKTTEDRSKSRGRSSPRPVKEKSSWSWFLFKTVLFFAVIVGGYFGWTVYRTKARSSRF
jgi:mannose-binding lectin 2